MSLFITFEGIEGSGKSTQAFFLKKYLEDLGKKVILTREPGGTEFAENIRKLILNNDGISDTITELLLLAAARRDHLINLIQPKLTSGYYVICDRFIDSSLVYQGVVKGLGINFVNNLMRIAIGDFKPNLTFLLDIAPENTVARINSRSEDSNFYDRQSLEFHESIRMAFLKLAANDCNRIKVINSERSIEEIKFNIIALIKELSTPQL